jgi:hypothetical protein
VITSIVNIAGPSSEPVILCAVSSGNGNSTVVAIDLYDLVLLWSFEIEAEVNGQFVVMNQPTKKQVVFSTKNKGIIAIGGHS